MTEGSALASALSGKTALVIGASSGIGLSTANLFADSGAKVHAAARRARPSAVIVPTTIALPEAARRTRSMLQPGADPVRKVSIIPRGMALGVTLSAPDVERSNYEEQYLLGRIKVALGGRVAEEVVYGTITAGAESDIQQLTMIARQMVGRWGMSEKIGPVSVLPGPNEGPLFPGQPGSVSPQTLELVDAEVRHIIDDAFSTAVRLLEENRGRVESLARALLERETLDERDAYEAAGFPAPSKAELHEEQHRADEVPAT